MIYSKYKYICSFMFIKGRRNKFIVIIKFISIEKLYVFIFEIFLLNKLVIILIIICICILYNKN